MASKTVIRSAPIFFKSKKVAEIESADYEINSNDEDQFGSEGWMGSSSGATTTSITCNVIVPVAGLTVTLTTALLNKEQVQIGVAVDGKLHQIDMQPKTAKFTTDSKTGTLKGSFMFSGGAPQPVG
jgi:hypothetical protein